MELWDRLCFPERGSEALSSRRVHSSRAALAIYCKFHFVSFRSQLALMLGSSYELGEQDPHLGSQYLPYYYRSICFGDYSIPSTRTYGQDKQKMVEGFLHFPQRENMNIKGNP